MNVDSPADATLIPDDAPSEASARSLTPPRSALLLNSISLVLSFIGIFVASVLSIAHALAKSIPCGEDGGCDIVSSNPASLIFGVPVAYLGLGTYLLLGLITVIRGFRGLGPTRGLGTFALALSGAGALFSFYLQYISFMQIHALCTWCLVSAVTMSLLFLTQAGIAQNEIPAGAGKAGDGGLIMTVALTLLCVTGVGYSTMLLSKNSDLGGISRNATEKLVLTPDSMRLGPDDAPVKIVEFSDLLCPSCRAIYPDVKDLVESSNGKVQLILRHRPLTKNTTHQMATPAAFYAEYAAENGMGWKFVDAMYDHDVMEVQTIDQLNAIAKEAGLDLKDAQKRMVDTDPLWQRVMRDLEDAEKIGITETPTFIIFAKGQIPLAAAGRELIRTIKRPEYQALIHPDGQ